ncbi:MAG: ankyrin repeat domain-containing protein [Pseudomonadota bacterium]|nr:ankyrin repeat domain-containing protein [Pseudomonadota bacterium]
MTVCFWEEASSQTHLLDLLPCTDLLALNQLCNKAAQQELLPAILNETVASTDTHRASTRNTSVGILKLKALLAIAVILCAHGCIIRDDAQSKFIAFNFSPHVLELNLLMPKIFAQSWQIGYRYRGECQPEERLNSVELQETISAVIRTWLAPLKELKPPRPMVDKFIYEQQTDFNPISPNDFYNLNEPEDLESWQAVDLRVTFECTPGVSYALIGIKYPPAIYIKSSTKVTPNMLATLTHELGHAFGLADTFARAGVMHSRGGLARTTGKQPASIMAMSSDYSAHEHVDTQVEIGEDDRRGAIWLYKYFHENLASGDCFFDDYVAEGYVSADDPDGCAPRHPLIFEVKHSPPKHALQLLKDDPTTDVNTQDVGGMTALHYAVMYGKQEVVKALLAHQNIKPSLKNKQGETAHDIAVAVGDSEILKLFPAPPRRKEDVNDDGTINILDLIAVAQKFGQQDAGNADVNGDGTINVADLVLVASALGTTAAAPTLYAHAEAHLTAVTVAGWLAAAQKLNLPAAYARGVSALHRLHAYLTPSKTELLANYPNPFNPDTWLPYRLDKAAQVNIHIYDSKGQLVRTLALGSQPAGVYQDKSRAAHWNGRNNQGERVASGVYFYTLAAGNFTATRKMLLRK